MRHEKMLVLMIHQRQKRLQNQRGQHRAIKNTPRMMRENQRVLKVKIDVLLVMARRL